MLEEWGGLQIFRQIESIFYQIKRQLFVDEWARDSTKLFFAFVNTKETPMEIDFFQSQENGSYLINKFDTENYLDYSERIDNIMRSGLGRNDFVKEQLDILKLNNCSVKIWCICVSVCFSQNNAGKMLLRKTFRTFINYLSGWCRILEMADRLPNGELQVESIDNFHEVVQAVLEKAALEVRRDLEGFYSPIKILHINSLSGEYYEKAECRSNLLFLPPVEPMEIDISKFAYVFRAPWEYQAGIAFVPENFRWIRKLIQMTQEHLYLVFQNDPRENIFKVLGICESKNIASLLITDYEETPYFTVHISRHMQWNLFLGSSYIFSFRNGEYKITMEMPLSYLTEKCQEIFGGRKAAYTKVAKSISESRKQTHGTMLVVLPINYVKSEVERLSQLKAGIKDESPREQVRIINNLNAIDGCVMLDTEGKIHGIGMILDGDNSTECNPARGSRYNSALKYRNYLIKNGIPGLILIVSEDGSTEIISARRLDADNGI